MSEHRFKAIEERQDRDFTRMTEAISKMADEMRQMASVVSKQAAAYEEVYRHREMIDDIRVNSLPDIEKQQEKNTQNIIYALSLVGTMCTGTVGVTLWLIKTLTSELAKVVTGS